MLQGERAADGKERPAWNDRPRRPASGAPERDQPPLPSTPRRRPRRWPAPAPSPTADRVAIQAPPRQGEHNPHRPPPTQEHAVRAVAQPAPTSVLPRASPSEPAVIRRIRRCRFRPSAVRSTPHAASRHPAILHRGQESRWTARAPRHPPADRAKRRDGRGCRRGKGQRS